MPRRCACATEVRHRTAAGAPRVADATAGRALSRSPTPPRTSPGRASAPHSTRTTPSRPSSSGASNQFAHAASKAVATQPGDHYNPLFLYGGVGLGKDPPRQRDRPSGPGAATGRARRLPLLRRLHERPDQLAPSRPDGGVQAAAPPGRRAASLDDVQLLAGRERTQEEFFHTFNSLYERRCQIVLTSDKVPEGHPRSGGAAAQPVRVGADRRHPAARRRDAGRHRSSARPSSRAFDSAPTSHSSWRSRSPRTCASWRGPSPGSARTLRVERREITVDYAREVLAARPPAEASAAHLRRHRRGRLRPLRAPPERPPLPPPEPARRGPTADRHVSLPPAPRAPRIPHIGELFERDHSTVIHATQLIERASEGRPGVPGHGGAARSAPSSVQ